MWVCGKGSFVFNGIIIEKKKKIFCDACFVVFLYKKNYEIVNFWKLKNPPNAYLQNKQNTTWKYTPKRSLIHNNYQDVYKKKIGQSQTIFKFLWAHVILSIIVFCLFYQPRQFILTILKEQVYLVSVCFSGSNLSFSYHFFFLKNQQKLKLVFKNSLKIFILNPYSKR